MNYFFETKLSKIGHGGLNWCLLVGPPSVVDKSDLFKLGFVLS